MKDKLTRFIKKTTHLAIAKREEGLTTVEYALLLVLVALAAWGAFQALGTAVSTKANKAATDLMSGG